MKRRRLAVALALVVITGVSFYFVGPLKDMRPNIKGLGGFVEPKRVGSGFVIANLSIQPTKVQPNERVTITVSVANTHNTSGVYSLILQIDGLKEAETQATVDAGGTQNISFSTAREKPGIYAVFINGLSGSFTVASPSPQ